MKFFKIIRIDEFYQKFTIKMNLFGKLTFSHVRRPLGHLEDFHPSGQNLRIYARRYLRLTVEVLQFRLEVPCS